MDLHCELPIRINYEEEEEDNNNEDEEEEEEEGDDNDDNNNAMDLLIMDLQCERPIHTCFCQLCNTAQPSLVHCVKRSNYLCQCSAVCTLYIVQWWRTVCSEKYALALYKSAAPAEIALECCVHCALPMQWKCVQKSAKQCIMDCILGNTLQLTIIRNVYRKVQSVRT